MNIAKQRLTLKVTEDEVKRIKKQAIDEGKTLSDFIVDETTYYGFKFTDFCTLRIDHIDPIKQGSDFVRIDIMFFESGSERVLRGLWYELWVSQEYVEDQLKIQYSPTKKEYADFGFRFIANRYKENENILPSEYGAFVTENMGIKLVNSREELWNLFDSFSSNT